MTTESDTERKAKRRRYLLDIIEGEHDFVASQTYQWEATGTYTEYQCGICGLQWSHYRGGQNSPDQDIFETFNGEPLPLIRAAQRHCG